MARPDQANPSNAPGSWFVDTRCIKCDAARNWAPDFIDMDAKGLSYVSRQPSSPEEEAVLWRAVAACPTKSIGNLDRPREPGSVFPYQLTDGVFALGNNALSSFAAHSYLLEHPLGNLMVDSPRFNRPLAESIDALGGIAHVLLTHRDDVADADRWADRYGARVWIGEADADAAPYATDVTGADSPTSICLGVVSIPAPGHTKGHVMYHFDDRCLFTGDTLHWNHRRSELDVFPNQTFHSWSVLADTLLRSSKLKVDWVFPGHGMWNRIGLADWASQVLALGYAIRQSSQAAWAQRPGATYSWY